MLFQLPLLFPPSTISIVFVEWICIYIEPVQSSDHSKHFTLCVNVHPFTHTFLHHARRQPAWTSMNTDSRTHRWLCLFSGIIILPEWFFDRAEGSNDPKDSRVTTLVGYRKYDWTETQRTFRCFLSVPEPIEIEFVLLLWWLCPVSRLQ